MVTIRPAGVGDTAAVIAVHRAAFPSAAEARVVESLIAAGRGRVSVVAEENAEIVGHVLFSPVTVDGTDAGGLGLAPLAVVPARHRRGIGSDLVLGGLARCREFGCPFVVVLGHPAYYRRFGFGPAATAGMGNEYGAGDEFMVAALCVPNMSIPAGLVRYGPEFAEFAA